MQYFKPDDPRLFAGDCMPFFHDGHFHLYYLRDEEHHKALGGLGGHQWAHMASPDLVQWKHHPLAIGISHPWEASICTGSIFFHEGTFYGFYATRMRDWTQHLSLATSTDGITFQKTDPNPFMSPPAGYDPVHFRDPFVFWNAPTGRFHMLVTAMLKDYPLQGRGGCLAHLTSLNLRDWEMHDPFYIPEFMDAPECSDYFFWRGWYYLLYSNGLVTRYRMSRGAFGPWLRPASDILDGPALRVMKTAPFTGDRRIGAAWIGTREGAQDEGRLQWGGHVVFREIIQRHDGTLGTGFPPELIPDTGDALSDSPVPLIGNVTSHGSRLQLNGKPGLAIAQLGALGGDSYTTAWVHPAPNAARFGIVLKGSPGFSAGYDLCFRPLEWRVELGDQAIVSVEEISRPFSLEIVIKGDLVDVCVGGQRCVINRCPEQHGEQLFFYAQDARVTFENLTIRPITLAPR